MSPRAAWRLESLGFAQVFDYVAGKKDWFSSGLPRAGRLAAALTSGDLARKDVPTCRLEERVGEVGQRVRAAGWSTCVVVNEQGVVLGRLRARALDEAADAAVEEVMQSGPSTIRPTVKAEALPDWMRERGMGSVLVTTSNGRLVGLLRREDAERALGG